MSGRDRSAAAVKLFHPTLFAIPLLVITAAAPAQTQLQNSKWDFAVWAAGITGEEYTNSLAEAQMLTAGFFVGRMLTGEIGHGWKRGRLEYGADIAPVFLQVMPQRIRGLAFDPILLRWHSGLRVGRATPFLELGGGAVRTAQDFPAGRDTSDFNFMARGGGGLQITTWRRQALEVSCRWWHISNANLGLQNPEFNGIQLGVAWHWLK